MCRKGSDAAAEHPLQFNEVFLQTIAASVATTARTRLPGSYVVGTGGVGGGRAEGL